MEGDECAECKRLREQWDLALLQIEQLKQEVLTVRLLVEGQMTAKFVMAQASKGKKK